MTNSAIIAELYRIAKKHDGELKPSDVVEAARDEESPLHSQFEWDDTEAAEKYRLHQARNLIRVTVQFVGPKDDPVTARVFVSLTSDRVKGGAGYRVTSTVMSDPEYRKQLLADALEEMKRFEQKYADLKELVGVFAAMRKVGSKSHVAA